ncbi:uncharacterized protein V6R79_021173 [Siganus canaliculatus]
MSRKKAVKGKNASSSPCAGSPTGKGTGKAAKSSPGIVQMNGVVHPSRPSISNSSEFYDIAFKVMLVGDSGVGKTCLLVRFKDGAFLAGSFISTVGIDFRNKVLNIDGVKVKLQIWDTAGQERFRSVTHAYYRDAHALLLLYDVTNKSSFDNIQAWLTEIHEYAQQDVVLMLLGNKASSIEIHSRVYGRTFSPYVNAEIWPQSLCCSITWCCIHTSPCTVIQGDITKPPGSALIVEATM